MGSTPKITGMHLVFFDRYIKVKRKKIQSDNIRPKPQIRYGVPQEDGTVKLVKSASTPVYRGDIVDRIIDMASQVETPPWQILFEREDEEYDEEAARSQYKLHVEAILAGTQDIPLETYKRAYADFEGNIVDKPTRYQVKDVDEATGKEQLEEFPYLEATKLFPINDATVQPRIYWDELLREGDMLYEVYADDDVGRFALWEIANKLNAWEYGEGHPLHGKGPQEVMVVVEGVHMTSGTTQEYMSLIAPKRIIESDGSEKFILLMKNSQSNLGYAHLMNVPKAGETPVTVQVEQRPLIMASFADLVSKKAA